MVTRNATVVALCLAAATGCMQTHPQTNSPQESAAQRTAPEPGSTTASAIAPAATDQLLNNTERADKLVGEDVLTSDHQRAGKIDNFVLNQESGEILYAVIGIGGVLGIGETRVAVPPSLFTEAKKGSVQVNTDKHKLTRAPQVLGGSEKAPKVDLVKSVYGYFGEPANWQLESPATASSFNSARNVTDLIGMIVQNGTNQDLGKVETIILNVPAGREVYVILSPSSDMNLGNNYYALPPKAVKFSPDQKTLVTDVTRQKLANAPHLAKDNWSELSNLAWARKVYQYYGQTGLSEIQPTGRVNESRPLYSK